MATSPLPVLPPYRITQTGQTGFVTVPGDELELITDPDELMLYIPTVFQDDTFTDTLSFEVLYKNAGNTEQQYVAVTEVTVLQSGTVTATVSGTSVSLSGSQRNVFNDEILTFVMPDMSIKTLPSDTTEDYLALIRYQMPSIVTTMISYSFRVKSTNPYTTVEKFDTITMSQWIHWKYENGKALVQRIVATRPKAQT